jgi:protein SCO1
MTRAIERQRIPMKAKAFQIALMAAVIALVSGVAMFMVLLRMTRAPLVGGNFVLAGVHGPVSLRDFRGKDVVLYFGYTGCPDACPMALGKLAKVVRQLKTEDQARIVPLFVSVDFRSDTAEKTDQYAKFFIKDAIGLTGTKAQLDEVVTRYGSSYRLEANQKTATGYTVQHAAEFYLIDSHGALSSTLPTELPDAELRRELESLR